MTRLTYDHQGFIVGAKKRINITQKIQQDTRKIVEILSQKRRIHERANHVFVRANTKVASKQIVGTPGYAMEEKTEVWQALSHRTNEQLKRHARQIMPKEVGEPKKTPMLDPKHAVPKEEVRFDKKTLRLLKRFTLVGTNKQNGMPSWLGGLLSMLPLARLGGFAKFGKYLLRALRRIPILAGVIGGISLLADWHSLNARQKYQGVGKLAGSLGGMMAGAIIGSMLIPIPGLGAIIGGIVGGGIGAFLGGQAGSGLHKIVTGEFIRWTATFGVAKLIAGLSSIWHKGIKPLLDGAKKALDWLKDKFLALKEAFVSAASNVVDTAKGVYGMAVDNVSEFIFDASQKIQQVFGSNDNPYAGQNLEKAILGKTYAKHKNGYFGAKRAYRNGIHMGQDYSTPIGTKVHAPEHGVVTDVSHSKNGGKMVTLRGDSGYTYKFAHLSKQPVAKGTRVNAGTVIAITGDTGVGNAHLHVEVIDPKGKHRDPLTFTIPSVSKSGNSTGASTQEHVQNNTFPQVHQGALMAAGVRYHKIGTINEKDLVSRGARPNQRIHKMAADSYDRMAADFKKATNMSLGVLSGYRPKEYQQQIIDSKKKRGLSDKQIYSQSAPAGYSEHQTGLAIDFSINGSSTLTNTGVWADNAKGYRWLAENAHRYGFYQTYTKGNAQGTAQENWHWAWRGNEEARQLLGVAPQKVATASTPKVNIKASTPIQPTALTPTPAITINKKSASNDTVIVKGGQTKDRSPLHKVV